MSEIRVEWRRVLNLAPYETETIVLGITETIDVKPISACLCGGMLIPAIRAMVVL